MKTATIQIKGINRSVPSQLIDDGWLDELINLRHRDGKLQPVGKPVKLYERPVLTYPKMWHHDQDGISNFIGLSLFNHLQLVNLETRSFTEIKTYPPESYVRVEFLKRFMIVIHSTGIDKYIWKDNEYKSIIINSRPEFSLYTSDQNYVHTEAEQVSVFNEDLINTLMGWHYKLLNNVSSDGYFTGGMFIRATFKMFDGSYILHSMPRFIAVNNFEIGIYWDKGTAPDPFNVGFTTAKLNIIIPTELHTWLATMKDIISEVVIFGTQFQQIINWDESINDEILDYLSDVAGIFPNGPAIHYLNSMDLSVNPDFKKMHDSPSWYKLSQYSVSKILEGDINEEIDLKNFYQDYATRETLPVDQFSHHEFFAGNSYNYNSRLILCSVKTKFADYKYFPLEPILDGTEYPNLMPSGYAYLQTKNIRLLVTLETSLGTFKKLGQAFSVKTYGNLSIPGSVCFPIALGSLAYPDARATKIEILYEADSVADEWAVIGSYMLTKSLYDNFAYYIDPDFNTTKDAHLTGAANYPVIIHTANYSATVIHPSDVYPEQVLNDLSRVQISELVNPFYFPAKYSYNISTGEVIAAGTNTEPLSTGQYGEYPLVVFTTKGSWAMLQGQGDILFSSVKPLNGDVPINVDLIVSTGRGVLYTTKRGLFLVYGTSVTELSQPLNGSHNSDLQSVENFTFRINNVSLVQLSDSVSTTDTYMSHVDTKVGYNKTNNEILVTNPNYNYSYVYSLDTNHCFKISESYTTLINSYPDLLGIRKNYAPDGVFKLTEEVFESYIETLIVTRPAKIDNIANFNLIHRIIQRCELQVQESAYAGFYVFASNDLKTWQLFQGTDKKTGNVIDLFCTRSHTKAKYFIFVFAGKLLKGSAINQIEIQYYSKLDRKIR